MVINLLYFQLIIYCLCFFLLMTHFKFNDGIKKNPEIRSKLLIAFASFHRCFNRCKICSSFSVFKP